MFPHNIIIIMRNVYVLITHCRAPGQYKYKCKYICIAQNRIMKYSVALHIVPGVIEFILSIIEFFKQMSFQFASETCFICTCFNVIW